MDIANAIRNQYRGLRRLILRNLPDDNDVLTRANFDIQRLKGSKRVAVALRVQAQVTAQLVSKIQTLLTNLTRICRPQLVQLLSYRRADILNAH